MSSQVRIPFPRLQISQMLSKIGPNHTQLSQKNNNHLRSPSSPSSNLQLRDHNAFHLLQTGILALERNFGSAFWTAEDPSQSVECVTLGIVLSCSSPAASARMGSFLQDLKRYRNVRDRIHRLRHFYVPSGSKPQNTVNIL